MAKVKQPNIFSPIPQARKYSKEELVSYRKIAEAFMVVANLTTVIEERLLDRRLIPDLTLAELHVLEAAGKLNHKPMTKIAQALKITVGALSIAITRLVQKEYLLRTRSDKDRRVILISVTPKAQRVLRAHQKFHDDIIGLTVERVSLTDAANVLGTLAEMIKQYDLAYASEKEKK